MSTVQNERIVIEYVGVFFLSSSACVHRLALSETIKRSCSNTGGKQYKNHHWATWKEKTNLVIRFMCIHSMKQLMKTVRNM